MASFWALWASSFSSSVSRSRALPPASTTLASFCSYSSCSMLDRAFSVSPWGAAVTSAGVTGTGARGVSSWWGVSHTNSSVISTVASTVSSILPRVRNTPCRHRKNRPTGGRSSVSTRPARPLPDTARGLLGFSTRAA